MTTPAGLTRVGADQFRQAMRRPANAVAVIATGPAGDRHGVTLTAVCSLSDSPPSLLACLYRESAALAPIRRNRCFSVNFLAADQSALASVFAGRDGLRGDARFAPDLWITLETGAPVLRGAVAAFDCHLDREVDSPTHAVLFGGVAALRMADEAPQGALTYSSGGFGRFVPLTG